MVKVIPRSSKEALISWDNKILKVRLTSPPVKGKANQSLIAFLSKILSIPKSQITIKKGESSSQKTLVIEGISEHDLDEKLLAALS